MVGLIPERILSIVGKKERMLESNIFFYVQQVFQNRLSYGLKNKKPKFAVLGWIASLNDDLI